MSGRVVKTAEIRVGSKVEISANLNIRPLGLQGVYFFPGTWEMSMEVENPNILIVEDEPGTVEMYQIVLEVEGYRVSVAYTISSEINALEEEKPDLVLLDLMMPQVDGWERQRRSQRVRRRERRLYRCIGRRQRH